MSNLEEFVTCESVASIVLHVRRIGDRPVHLGGHVSPRPLALCQSMVAWDTKRPVSTVGCRDCRDELQKLKVI